MNSLFFSAFVGIAIGALMRGIATIYPCITPAHCVQDGSVNMRCMVDCHGTQITPWQTGNCMTIDPVTWLWANIRVVASTLLHPNWKATGGNYGRGLS
jgi:hypothetical protein